MFNQNSQMMKKHLSMALAALFLLLAGTAAFAQSITRGKIVDTNGEPVIGASVVVPGTTTGVVTDIDGNFEIRVAPGTRLEISSIGYATLSVTAAPTLNITLEEDTTFLDDVVVIGYQTVKRRDLTGSVASITGKELAEMPVANAVQALQGRLPGVRVSSGNGAAGSSATIRVRGGNSITQSNDPLVLIDGVSGSLADIPADQIEAIDVLKDASSTAIYGARGANGVILVTTKGAKSGRVRVRYNMYYQFRENPRFYDLLDTQEFVLWQWSYASFYGSSYGQNVAKYYGLGPENGNHYKDYASVPLHNSMSDVLKSSGTWNHDITLSGGTEATNYSLGFNYLSDNGTHIRNQRERYSINFKLNQKINDKLSANFDVRYFENFSWGDGNNTGASNYYYRPVLHPLGEDNPALLGQGDSNVNTNYDPLLVTYNLEDFNRRHNLRGTAGLTWNAFNGFVARSELTLGRGWSKRERWDGGNSIGGSSRNSARLNDGFSTNTRWTNTISYTIPGLGDDHNLNFLIGHEMMTNTGSNRELRAYGYSSDLSYEQAFAMFGNYDTSLVDFNSFSNSETLPNNTLSFFGRLNYSLKGRYLFTATFRADGSSKFAPNNRWGYFPAGAFAWRVSDEPWMKGAKRWMDELKFRLSYGTSGSDGISASLWKETWRTAVVTMDGKDYNVYRPNDMLPNPDLKWETTISRNAGVDFSFLKTRLRGSLDLYWNTTKDLLMRMPIDATTGYSYQYQNVGQTSNRGIELALNAGIVRNRNFQLALNWNHSINFNKLDSIDPSANANQRTGWGGSDMLPNYDYLIEVGRPIGLVNGYVAEGVGFYTVDDFNYANGVYTLKPGIHDTSVAKYASTDLDKIRPNGQVAFPGAVRFEDVNGDGIANAADYKIITEMQPHHTGGFGFQANWKNFDLSANFAYQIGGFLYNAMAMSATNFGNKDTYFGRNRLAYVNDCYKIYDVDASGNLYMVTDPAELNRLNANAKYAVALSEAGFTTSQFIESGSFLRLNNLTLGYTIPQSILDKIRISNLRVYVTGTNLFTLSGYSGLDPEIGGSDLTPGFDNGNYPRPLTVTAGLSVTF
jgi:TonB-linked SusC/RagA family outer membrane protein